MCRESFHRNAFEAIWSLKSIQQIWSNKVQQILCWRKSKNPRSCNIIECWIVFTKFEQKFWQNYCPNYPTQNNFQEFSEVSFLSTICQYGQCGQYGQYVFWKLINLKLTNLKLTNLKLTNFKLTNFKLTNFKSTN